MGKINKLRYQKDMEGAQVSDDEKAFIEFVINYIVTSNPGYFTQSVAKIDKAVRELAATDKLNLYRKKFGNMDGALKTPASASVMHIEGNNVKFSADDAIKAAHAAGTLTDAALAKYEEGKVAHEVQQAQFNK